MEWSPRAKALTASTWLVGLIGELWFALQALPPPAWSGIALEVAAFGVLAASHVVLAKGPVTRSPYWAGLLLLGLALFANLAHGLLVMLFLAVGIGISCWAVARWVPPSPVAGLVFAAFAAVAGRWLVLSNMEAALADHAESSAVSSPIDTLVAELTEPLIPGRTPDASLPPLVLITVDTLRWDTARRMAAVKRLSEKGRSWERAMSASSWTLPAMASVHTGVLPEAHGADLRPGGAAQGIRADVPTLAEQLSDAGYRTTAFTTNPWMGESTGFTRGFDDFWAAHERPFHHLVFAGLPELLPSSAEAMVDATIAWMDDQDSLNGRFLWVHLIDPHTPFGHADPEVQRWSTEGSMQAGANLTEAQRAAVRAAYEVEVAYTDTHVMRLLDALDARPELARGRLVFTADHGEEFWDHGGTLHGHSHHTEVVDVPLIVVGEGVSVGAQHTAVSLVDIAPTLRAAAGLDPDGLDLAGPIPAGRITSAWGSYRNGEMASAADTDTKVIRDERGVRAYERSDLQEQHALEADAVPPEVRRAAAEAKGPEQGEAADVNTEALRALGYVQ